MSSVRQNSCNLCWSSSTHVWWVSMVFSLALFQLRDNENSQYACCCFFNVYYCRLICRFLVYVTFLWHVYCCVITVPFICFSCVTFVNLSLCCCVRVTHWCCMSLCAVCLRVSACSYFSDICTFMWYFFRDVIRNICTLCNVCNVCCYRLGSNILPRDCRLKLAT